MSATVHGEDAPPSRPSRDPVYEHWRWRIFALGWLAYAGFYLTRKSFAVVKIELGRPESLDLSQAQMAWIDGAFLTAYALGQFVWGLAGDRFGTRRVVLSGMLGSVVVAIAMGAVSPAYLPDWMTSVVGLPLVPASLSALTLAFGGLFFAQGLLQASGWAPLAKNMANFFSRRERGFVMGLWCTNYAVGGMVASAYAGFLGERFGWRAAFVVPAITLLGIWFVFLAFQRDRPEDVGLPPIETYHAETEAAAASLSAPASEVPGDNWAALREVLSNRVVWILCAVYFCLKPARYAILFWGPKYINTRLGTNMTESGLLSGLFEAAGPLSVFLAGWISDRWFGAKRMPVAVICLGLLGGLLILLDRMPASAVALGSCLFLMGLLTYAPDSLLSGIAPVDFGTKRGASTASGLINGFGSVGAILGGTLPAWFQEQGGWLGIFALLGGAVLLAGIILVPLWNVVPDEPSRPPGRA